VPRPDRQAGAPRPGQNQIRRPREPGFTIVEAAVAAALVAIVLAAAWGWQGSVTARRLQNAAYLLEGDLRWAQQIAVANAGAGPQAELCLRADGYDVYTTAYAGGDPLNINPAAYAAVAGSRVKSVHRGEEYAAGIQIAPPPAGTVACTADPARVAVAFRASGQPLFTDGAAHSLTVSLQGRSYLVTVQPYTGRTAVSTP
jgi:type II secretory pathway pseudopilin PulG